MLDLDFSTTEAGMRENTERWKQLCELAKEQDPQRLLELTREINDLLLGKSAGWSGQTIRPARSSRKRPIAQEKCVSQWALRRFAIKSSRVNTRLTLSTILVVD